MRLSPIAACNLQLLPLQPLQPSTPPWYTQFSSLISPCITQIAHGFCLKIQYTEALPQKIPFSGRLVPNFAIVKLYHIRNPNLPTPAVALKRFARIQNKSTQTETRHIPTTISIVGQTMKSMNILARSKTDITAYDCWTKPTAVFVLCALQASGQLLPESMNLMVF